VASGFSRKATSGVRFARQPHPSG